MSPARSILGVFRHWLLRETGLYLGLLAVAMQLGLAVAHVAPARAEGGIALPWCSGATAHEPLAPEAAHAGSVCPLCQLPPLGPEPSADTGFVAPVVWPVEIVFLADEVPAGSGAPSSRPIQPRAPPAFA